MEVGEHDNVAEDPGLLIWDLLPNLSQTRQNPRIHFDAILQILNPQTLILPIRKVAISPDLNRKAQAWKPGLSNLRLILTKGDFYKMN